MAFSTLDDFRALLADMPGQDETAIAAATERNGQLTKPPGALGMMESLAVWLAGWHGVAAPKIEAPQITVFAGNHGVAAKGVSAFPAEVTVQMVANFQHGGAAINQLAKACGARLDVHALDLDNPTADFTEDAAMTEEEVVAALKTGWDAVDEGADLLAVGEMGIGNTTSASALAQALYGGADWTGRGTGVEGAALDNKRAVVKAGVDLHGGKGDGLETLRRLGGREIAAMAGAMARARQLRVPVVLDGFIATAAAACLAETQDGALDHLVAGHQSAEGAHVRLLEILAKPPLLALGLRLGEGSGAAVAINIVKAAIACHSGMATFAEAGVSEG